MKRFVILWAVFISVTSCDTNRGRQDNAALREEMKSKEVKRVTDSEIFEKAFQIGDEIAKASQMTLGQNLKSSIQSEGVTHAVKFCNLTALTLVDSLSKQYKADIGRTSLRLRNPQNQPDSLETIILEAYQYNLSQGLSLNPNLQRIDRDYLLYTKPIVLDNPLCLACHGEPGTEISAEAVDLLRSLYPEDNATNIKIGELRGMWSIKLSQKEVVLSL